MSTPLKKLRDGRVRSSDSIDRTAAALRVEHAKQGNPITQGEARRFVEQSLHRHDRKTGND